MDSSPPHQDIPAEKLNCQIVQCQLMVKVSRCDVELRLLVLSLLPLLLPPDIYVVVFATSSSPRYFAGLSVTVEHFGLTHKHDRHAARS